MIKIIPLIHERSLSLPTPTSIAESHTPPIDQLSRPLHDLRISVIDRCNFRCTYCMPQSTFDQHYPFLEKSSLLSFEEITRLVRIFVQHGVGKIRLTGGEPLLRKNLEQLIHTLSSINTLNGTPLELTLTTNGMLLGDKARALKEAGLRRITVSLDALDHQLFKTMTDTDVHVSDILSNIEQAHQAGLTNIKINMVVKKNVNEQEILPMVRHFKGTPFTLRFIEYMDVGSSHHWSLQDVVPSSEIVQRIHEHFPIKKIPPNYIGEPAERWRYQDGSGEIGVISSISQAFCTDCHRARLSADGSLFTCLFATQGYDLRALLRSHKTDAELLHVTRSIWQNRVDQYSALRHAQAHTQSSAPSKIEMSYIGG